MSQSSIACVKLFNQVENQTSKDRGKVNMSGIISQEEMLANARKWREREQAELKAKTSFIKDIINEYATYESFGGHSYGLSLSVYKLERHDRRLFLSHIVDADDFEWFCESESRLDAGFKEYADQMQKLIDEHIDEVWHENMQECGRSLKQHSDNGEYYY